MSASGQPPNGVKRRRLERGWSQQELARRAGVSRAAVSAVEINRLVPSVASALSLAAALNCSVEDLFASSANTDTRIAWAWPPASEPCRFWQGRVQGRLLHYPVEVTAAGEVAHDGLFVNGQFVAHAARNSEATLFMASCDPAAGIMAGEYARVCGFRLIVLLRSSRTALTMLKQGLVNVAGVHFDNDNEPNGNARAVKDLLGAGYELVRIARWQEGLTLTQTSGISTVRGALKARLRWVGREPGSAARQCLDELRAGKPAPRRVAYDHRGVAEAVRCGWADIGVCHRLASEDAGLTFFPVREENFDLCYPDESETDPRISALLRLICSPSYRRLLGELPGFDTRQAGQMQSVR